MQTLLNDIELDIQELKFLLQAISGDANPALRIVAKRNIQQMQERLNMLVKQLDEASIATSVIEEPIPSASNATPSILAERIKSAADLRHAISLNDSFRFTRELFDGDAARMNQVVREIGEASTLDKALDIYMSTVHPNEENEASADFIELLKKYYN